MTIVTPPPASADAEVQQTSNTTFEWKTLIEVFHENTNSTKYNELVQSILRWFVIGGETRKFPLDFSLSGKIC